MIDLPHIDPVEAQGMVLRRRKVAGPVIPQAAVEAAFAPVEIVINGPVRLVDESADAVSDHPCP